MSDPYDLTQLDSTSFENLVNFLALKVLGNGVVGFSPGPDGGRDGYLHGTSNYISDSEAWHGHWFIQSKFHKQHLSTNNQSWLIKQVKAEINEFESGNRQLIPDNWIISTNIEPSGDPNSGTYAKIKKMVYNFSPKINFDIWGGRKILDFLARDEDAARYYGHFLTPGHVISKLYDQLTKKDKISKQIIDHFIINQFLDLNYTKLEQAGSVGDQRPRIYELFSDLPISSAVTTEDNHIMDCLTSASNNVHTMDAWGKFGSGWKEWCSNPKRARIIVLKGGPGQGKSTAGQYFSQVQRAAFILSEQGPRVDFKYKEAAENLKSHAEKEGFWPTIPRIPVSIELKDYAKWYIDRDEYEQKNVIFYICHLIYSKTGKTITEELLCELLTITSWFINFDGLDEVPNDIKDKIANEIIMFTNEVIPLINADVLILCTTRPQGYSGQFDSLNCAVAILTPLSADKAIECATPVLKFNRSDDESEQSISILKSAINSVQVRQIMTTPLQSHIMAVVVRDGGRPPEKRWELFNNFYNVMKKREGLKNFPDKKILMLLRKREQLLKTVHDRLGISLHSKAEESLGAEATLNRDEFRRLTYQAALFTEDDDIDDLVESIMEATTERLVFVNTPESSDSVRFDIRQLQEFFSAEFIYNAVDPTELKNRLEIICGDAHWREVVHFALSALAGAQRFIEISVASDVLHRLDDDEENYKIRSFKKVLATGSLLTLRLLEEGVMEQDRRVRNLFAKTLGGLWNSTDKDIVLQILSVREDQSKKYLIKNLVDVFLERDFSEHIASGCLISFLVDEKTERFSEVRKRLESAPIFYIKSSLTLIDGIVDRSTESFSLKSWFCRFIVDQMMFNSIYDVELVDYVFNFIKRNHSQFSILFTEDYIGNDTEKVVGFIFNGLVEGDYNFSDKLYQPEQYEDKYAYLTISSYSKGYLSSVKERIVNLNISGVKIGSLQLIIDALSYIQCRSKKNLIVLAKAILERKSVVVMPDIVKALLPINFNDFNLQANIIELNARLESINFSDGEVFDHDSMPNEMIRLIAFKKEDFSETKWKTLCFEQPAIALQLLSDPLFRNHQINFDSVINDDAFYSPVFDLAYREARLFSNYFGVLSELLHAHPEKKNLLWGVFKGANLTNTQNQSMVRHSLRPFELSLNEDKEIFMLMVNHLLNTSVSLGIARPPLVMLGRHKSDPYQMSNYGVSQQDLIEAFTSEHENDYFKCCCLSFYMCLTLDGKFDRINYFFEKGYNIIYIDLLSKESNRFMVAALLLFFYDVNVIDDRTKEFIGEVLIIVKEDFEARYTLQRLFNRFRERSSAPVNKQNVLTNWLNYTCF